MGIKFGCCLITFKIVDVYVGNNITWERSDCTISHNFYILFSGVACL